MTHQRSIGSALLLGGWLAACSSPVPPARINGDVPVPDVELADGPVSEVALAGSLEAPPPVVESSTPPRTPKIHRPAPEREVGTGLALTALEVSPRMSAGRMAVDAPVALVAAPSAPALPAEARTDPPAREWAPERGARAPAGPTVIIRGGPAGVDDDCALHRPGLRRFAGAGAAVNRIVPPRGGYRGSR